MYLDSWVTDYRCCSTTTMSTQPSITLA